MPSSSTVAIVGASLAGAKAAEQLRLDGFGGRVLLIGEEPVRPYERPPLSKGYLRGDDAFDAAAVHGAGFYEEQDIELMTSTRAVDLDLAARELTLEPGGTVRFDQLVLATGATPRHLAIPGAELSGIYYLRSVEDADALRQAMDRVSKVVVVGAGWIGSEVAASARQLGKQVTLVETARVPLQRVLGSDVGAMFAQLHRDNGVDLRSGTGVSQFRGASTFEELVLADGTVIDGELVVVGVGVAPRVDLAERAGLAIDNGIVVDRFLATSSPDVWAIGDVANAFHPHYRTHIRLEHWSSALNQGPLAARNVLGAKVAYETIPYFFSDQYDLGMEYTGFASTWDEVVYRGDRAAREVIVFWLDHGRVVAGMNVNVWDVADTIGKLVASRRVIDPERLADTSVDLESFTR